MPRAITDKIKEKAKRVTLEYLRDRPADTPYVKRIYLKILICTRTGMGSTMANNVINEMIFENTIAQWQIKEIPKDKVAKRKAKHIERVKIFLGSYLDELITNKRNHPKNRTLDAILKHLNKVIAKKTTMNELTEILTDSKDQFEFHTALRQPHNREVTYVTLAPRDDKTQTPNTSQEKSQAVKIKAPGHTGIIIALATTTTPQWAIKINE